MELKNYQKAVIRDLERYLEILMQTKNIETAYTRLWQEKDVKVGFGGMPKYQNLLPGVFDKTARLLFRLHQLRLFP